MTMPWEDHPGESWLPADAERAMRWVLRAMYEGDRALAEMRDREVALKHEYERTRRRAMLSDDCPKVCRGGATVGERDAWVDAQCAADREHYELAQVATQAAQDHLRTLNAQSVVVAALAKNVGQMVGAGR